MHLHVKELCKHIKIKIQVTGKEKKNYSPVVEA